MSYPSTWRGGKVETQRPNPAHKHWASGHAIGFSEGIRESTAVSNRVHIALHRNALRVLKAGSGDMSTTEHRNELIDERARVIRTLEAVTKGEAAEATGEHQLEGRRSKDRNFEEVVGL
ncbi:hypothetical protein LCGC14_0984920 [marine sediment metagenome]|uniref:Uncharacterized protein n=1 Tax=marine sediment metagenome TaxID=412755 RepID=A0A0F9NTX7_9ZZZZ